MVIASYIEEQQRILARSLQWPPFVKLFTASNELYLSAIHLIPANSPPIFGQVLLVCHKSLLSAAVLIGQAQPDDAAPVTRRAIEAARFAAAIKTDPDNIDDWAAADARMQRWIDRQSGRKPKRIATGLGEVHSDIRSTLNELMQIHGILSDVSVHFTPEYLIELSWQKAGQHLVLKYFKDDERALEREIILTCGAHLRILEVIDWCLDGAFKSDSNWMGLVTLLKDKAEPLTRKFELCRAELRPQ